MFLRVRDRRSMLLCAVERRQFLYKAESILFVQVPVGSLAGGMYVCIVISHDLPTQSRSESVSWKISGGFFDQMWTEYSLLREGAGG